MKNLSIVTLAEFWPNDDYSWAIDCEATTYRGRKEHDPLDLGVKETHLRNIFWNGGSLYSDIATLRN